MKSLLRFLPVIALVLSGCVSSQNFKDFKIPAISAEDYSFSHHDGAGQITVSADKVETTDKDVTVTKYVRIVSYPQWQDTVKFKSVTIPRSLATEPVPVSAVK